VIERPYDHRNCQSLFGYAAAVHKRSGGVCQLCECGRSGPDFDLWRQMTVEHLIGESQGGYLRQVRAAVARRYPDLPLAAVNRIASSIDELNTISACAFCNSTTSRDRAPMSMDQLIQESTASPDNLVDGVRPYLTDILKKKQADVTRKLASVQAAFERDVRPALLARRANAVSPP
jgi:hypothetical protein